MQRLLVSVRGPVEAVEAAEGGAHIADVEFPASALGTPYPLNIRAVRKALDEAGFGAMQVSTNIGEEQSVRSTACQAALGVATAGADQVKCGLAGLPIESAVYLGRNLVRTVREWFLDKKVYPAVFADHDLAKVLDPLVDGPRLVAETDADGLLIDTFDKGTGRGLLDYYSVAQLRSFSAALHERGKEAWVAGSISIDEVGEIWATGVDVICVRGAACEAQAGSGRFGVVKADLVRALLPR